MQHDDDADVGDDDDDNDDDDDANHDDDDLDSKRMVKVMRIMRTMRATTNISCDEFATAVFPGHPFK